MLASIIGNYLVYRGAISDEQFEELLDEMKKVRVKLGLIAVSEGMMTQEQAEHVNCLQAIMDKRFGDIAVEKGYLTEGQVDSLLKLQGNPFLSLAQALENLEIMSVNILNDYLLAFQKENEFSNSSMDDLKSDEIDRILPLFVPAEETEFLGLSGVAFRTIMRCVDNNVFPLKASIATDFKCDKGAMQFVEGDRPTWLAIAGRKQGLLPIASLFGKEEFTDVNMDALDAVGELINCINGLYASELSYQRIETELYPPEFRDDMSGFKGSKMLVFPMNVGRKTVYMLIGIQNEIKMY